MTQLVPRGVLGSLQSAFESSACVLLLGPRQVGKTTLAREFGTTHSPSWTYVDLEQDKDRRTLEHFDGFAAAHDRKFIILDEAQCMPKVFPQLRNILDTQTGLSNDRTRWLILGSASPELEALTNKHLGGRFKRIKLAPFYFSELNVRQSLPTSAIASGFPATVDAVSKVSDLNSSHNLMRRLWIRGGFPLSFLAENEGVSLGWRRDYLESILGAQAPAREGLGKADLLMPLWERLVIGQGKTCDVHRLPTKLGCKRDELESLLRFLEKGQLIRTVHLWGNNLGKRLDKQPVWFIRDSGLLHAQLRFRNIEELLQNEIKGKSWEGFVLESLLGSAPLRTQAFYYRTKTQLEADFVLDFGADKRWVIEVKHSANHSVSRGFYRASEELNPERRFVVHGGKESFRSGHKGAVDWFCLSDAIRQFS